MAHKPPTSTQTICLRWVAARLGLNQGISPPRQGLLAQLTLLGWTSSGQPPGVSSAHGGFGAREDTAFKSPCPAPQVHVGVPRDPGYQPHMRKGALKQVSPEEITAAKILAIAREKDNQEEDYILSD